MYPGFYYSVAKHPSNMTDAELDDEQDCAERWFSECAEMGQGIATKETRRYNMVVEERARRAETGASGEMTLVILGD